jgi:hypothetical protein
VYDSTEHGMLTYASFKISDTKSVYFFKGNLQFNAMQDTHKTLDSTAKGTWRFAEIQWDVIGADNEKIAEDYDGWIDLFGFGTSGWNGGANAYQPWSTSQNTADYRSDDVNKNLTGDYVKADWGVYNAISNGGDTPNMWRTLTIEEWQYLFENNRWTLGKVDDMLCFMLIPKELSAPSGVEVNVISDSLSTGGLGIDKTGEHSFNIYGSKVSEGNTYTSEKFKTLENLGVVAFPCGGFRNATRVAEVGSYGHYQSTSACDKGNAYCFFIRQNSVQSNNSGATDGWSLRPVYDLNCDIHFVDADGTKLLDTTVMRGVTPIYKGMPALKSKAYTLTFSGWNKDPVAVESDMTYTAVYDSTQILYTSIFKDYDGTTLDTVKNCVYDFVPDTMPSRVLSEDYNYTFRWSVDESRIEENMLVYTAVCDSFRIKKNGAIRAFAYKVSDTDSVYFSQGNLQFNAGQGTHKTADSTATGTWRFADKQYDCIGDANSNISETYDGWIDLFGWGTSGWNSGATAYQPWATLTNTQDYYLGGSKNNSMTGDYAKADWGVFNAISNGGDEPNRWRTLTNAEWKYLLQNNQWTLGYIKDGTNSYLCFMLIPKTFIAPKGLTVDTLSVAATATVVSGLTVPSGNNYTVEQFEELEKLGVVALPCGGYRVTNGGYIFNFGRAGQYWSASADDYNACTIFFNSSYVNSSYSVTREDGYSVRLVQNVNVNIRFVNADGTTLLDTTVMRGTMPRYTHEAPTMTSTKEYRFDFKGWNKDLVEAESDMVYTAVYDSLKLNLNIHFMNADSTTLLDTIVARGVIPTYTRKEPTMASTKEYKFDFKRWNKDFVAAESDMVYIAVYDSTPVLYTSVFKNYDGTSLDTIKKCAYDSVTKVEPTREANLRYRFSPDGWSRDESQISDGILVYTAVYDSTQVLYTSIFNGCNGTLPDTVKKCAYDSVLNGKELTHRDAYNRYDFNSWTRDEGKIARDTLVYTAVYDTTKILYTQLYYSCDTLFKKFENCAYDFVPTMKTPNRDSTDYAYNFTGWSKDTSKIARDTLIFTAVYDSSFIMKKNGAIRYAYKISETDSVYFSQGNLQFTTQGTHKTADGTAQGTWRFAENQYDYIGSANSEISETYEGWIDLFGWGTSGWKSGATAYQPWSKSGTYSDYYPGGSYSNSLIGDYAKADWGVYNAISNGGNEPNKWRTLTTTEWQYLFKNNKWTLGYINDSTNSYLCFMLIPETFTASEEATVEVIGTADLTDPYKFSLKVPSTNVYTMEQFASLEKLGVVALPCSGLRRGTTMSDIGSEGKYWSSSKSDKYDAYEFTYGSSGVRSDPYCNRNYGQSVRLVQDRNLNIRFVNADGSTLLDTTVLRGTTPTYTREVPTKDSTDYAYHFKGWNKEIVEAECDMVYTAMYDSSFISKKNGALFRAAYKVSETKSVYFSQGNLQFTTQGTHQTVDSTAKGTWRFAENQWDIIGWDNTNISETYEGWIDLFCWGTSGWKSGANAYEPWSTSNNIDDYRPGESFDNDLTDTYVNADWGVYNAISNGGDEPNRWRTLTIAEWTYLFQNNSWTLGTVEGMVCFMFIPKGFKSPASVSVDILRESTTSIDVGWLSVPSTNIYTAAQFKELENLGVVALPCGGLRDGVSSELVGSNGFYWSSSVRDSNFIYNFDINSTKVSLGSRQYRYYGFSVRLVQDVQ